MPITNILVPIDGSTYSVKAFNTALDIAIYVDNIEIIQLLDIVGLYQQKIPSFISYKIEH